ncbi:MAG: hypothetical protein ACD_4C00136G0001 [uncultured bacterium (gcode 4)]|uniref:CSD domain-containing protein n=1 Tax=uncultured bacterium (gcode 4) TaxID=1234023 RepID=K2F6V0_9BACT|nr:MAG: hypothetical protein ACD_4C00136G0001 [uncultured bacterium (gcode 4)]
MVGFIKKLMEKGFGFIESEDLAKLKIQWDLFFHFTSINGWIEAFDTLREGQKVSFEVSKRKDWKNQAVEVEVISED